LNGGPAGIGEIGADGGTGGRGVLQGADEEQQADQLVVGAHARFAIERVDHVHVAAAHVLQRPCLVLAVLEFALLVAGKRHAERGGHPFTVGAAGVKREQAKLFPGHRTVSSGAGIVFIICQTQKE
jgi:hypothetical protein